MRALQQGWKLHAGVWQQQEQAVAREPQPATGVTELQFAAVLNLLLCTTELVGQAHAMGGAEALAPLLPPLGGLLAALKGCGCLTAKTG